jgi:hypothetical protein
MATWAFIPETCALERIGLERSNFSALLGNKLLSPWYSLELGDIFVQLFYGFGVLKEHNRTARIVDSNASPRRVVAKGRHVNL